MIAASAIHCPNPTIKTAEMLIVLAPFAFDQQRYEPRAPMDAATGAHSRAISLARRRARKIRMQLHPDARGLRSLQAAAASRGPQELGQGGAASCCRLKDRD